MPPASAFTCLPNPPYYAVVFTSLRSAGDQGYQGMAKLMETLAAEQPGFLGVESVRDAQGLGITVSYWESLAAIQQWKNQAAHLQAQNQGRTQWYAHYRVQICRVERAYEWPSAAFEEVCAH